MNAASIMSAALSRRGILTGGLASAGLAALPLTSAAGRVAVAAAELKPVVLPPPIGRKERAARLARARQLMAANGIGAMVIEPGASLDYFTGIQWWRSERLTAAVVLLTGDPIIVTPFFEKPSVAESLGIAADIRTWNEDEDPLALVAAVLREQKVTGTPVGIEETNRFFIVDRLQQNLPGVRIVSANPVVRGCRMHKTAAELACLQAASDITIAAFRQVAPRVREGMTPDDLDTMIGAATRALGGTYGGGLVLIGEATAYPHGSHQPQRVARGANILFDCGCAVHGYQSDISRSFVWGADPAPEQRKVWDQVARGQQIALAAARLGAPAGSVDDAVRAAYASWGYGPGYRLPGLSHRTGHGIGMEGHEPVNLVHGERQPLEVGMCFSNEPGLYLPGKFGIRLEDCFHMTQAGPRWFTTPPRSIDQPFD